MTLLASVSAGTVTGFGTTVPAAFGRGGAISADAKREGDGASPLGAWPIRAALLRRDRVTPPITALATAIPWRWLRPDDGWSDDAADPAYNRPVNHPHRFGAERLWRDDGAYDIIVILGQTTIGRWHKRVVQYSCTVRSRISGRPRAVSRSKPPCSLAGWRGWLTVTNWL